MIPQDSSMSWCGSLDQGVWWWFPVLTFFDALAFVTIILVCADGATSGGTFFA